METISCLIEMNMPKKFVKYSFQRTIFRARHTVSAGAIDLLRKKMGQQCPIDTYFLPHSLPSTRHRLEKSPSSHRRTKHIAALKSVTWEHILFMLQLSDAVLEKMS